MMPRTGHSLDWMHDVPSRTQFISFFSRLGAGVRKCGVVEMMESSTKRMDSFLVKGGEIQAYLGG